MIRKFSYGKPIETEAVVKNIEIAKEDVPYFSMVETEGDEKTISFLFHMEEEDIVYGLGENVRGINKRGFLYKSKCSDDPCHQESTNSLYGAHNFILNSLVYSGLFGTIMLILIAGKMVLQSVRVILSDSLSRSYSLFFACALISYISISLFHNESLATGTPVLFILYGLLVVSVNTNFQSK